MELRWYTALRGARGLNTEDHPFWPTRPALVPYGRLDPATSFSHPTGSTATVKGLLTATTTH